MAPLLDLLTSVKYRSKEPIRTAAPAGGSDSFRICLERKPQHVRIIQDKALWLWALVPKWGAAQFSVRFLLSIVDYPLQDPVPCVHIEYACFSGSMLGDRRNRIVAQVRHWARQPVSQLQNGWGFLVRTTTGTTAGHGAVPPEVVRKYSSRKAFIFFLEVNAQILALLASRHDMSPFWVGFIDNQAGKAALSRGFNSEASVNNLLAFFWALCAELKWFAHCEWVASHLNIADPISRGRLEVADQAGARLLHGVPEEHWQLLLRIADDMQYAGEGAVQAALRWHFVFQ